MSEDVKKRMKMLWIGGAVMAMMPFTENHLLQKLELLVNGWLKKPMDVFDLVQHGGLLTAAIIYTVYQLVKARRQAAASARP